MDGVFAGALADIASRQLPFATVNMLVVGPAEALSSGLEVGASARVVIAPAELVPLNAWQAFLDKSPVVLCCRIESAVIREIVAYTAEDIATAPAEVAEVYGRGNGAVLESEAELICMFAPRTRLLVAGSGPIAEALGDVAGKLGWDIVIETAPANFAGVTATLSSMDCVVVMGHDVEFSSRCLQAALESPAAYIGALGSRKMQQSRADWLAFRDVTDLSRVHGPAGFDIGASQPYEIAVSILAEALAVKAGKA